MTATGTGGIGMPMEDEFPEDELGLDDELDMGDEGGGLGLDDELDVDVDAPVDDVDVDVDEEMGGGSVDLDTLRKVLDDCCPDKTDMVLSAVEAEAESEGLGGEDDGLDMDVGVGGDEGLGDEELDMDVEVGAGEGDVDDMIECGMAGMPEGEDEMHMESKVAAIANLITEDPDIFIRRRRRR